MDTVSAAPCSLWYSSYRETSESKYHVHCVYCNENRPVSDVLHGLRTRKLLRRVGHGLLTELAWKSVRTFAVTFPAKSSNIAHISNRFDEIVTI